MTSCSNLLESSPPVNLRSVNSNACTIPHLTRRQRMQPNGSAPAILGPIDPQDSLVPQTAVNCLLHADLTSKILDAFYDVYHDLGAGFMGTVGSSNDWESRLNVRCPSQ